MQGADNEVCELRDPDCLKCMRKKLDAVSVGVFFRDQGSWRLAAYQSEKPQEDAEVEFYCMLSSGVPEIVSAYPSGLILSDGQSIEQVFGPIKNLLAGRSVIAAPVSKGDSAGVRIAWRDAANPFSREDLRIIQCFGDCPDGC